MDRNPFGLEDGGDARARDFIQIVCEDVRIEQDRRQFAKQIGLGPSSGLAIGR